jgi:hypothetical protein
MRTSASGLTSRTPSVNAFSPAITVGIGCAATKPITFDLVMDPATSPVR